MLGTALTEVAVRENIEVYAIVRPNTNRIDRFIESPKVHLIYGLLENLKQIEGLPANCDVLYHFAWVGTGRVARDDPQIQVKNIQYTLESVELAERMGCHRFVYAGSQAEYGPIDGIIDENTKFAPVLSYGIAKYAAGNMGRRLCAKKGIDHIWGRVFSVYGPHDNEGTMLEHAIWCWENNKIAKFSSGLQMWNYLYETDAGEMFYRLGLNNVPSGTYFVANPESKILREYIELMMKAYGSNAKAVFAPVTFEQASGLNVNMVKTTEMLNFKPLVKFEDGIKRMIEFKTHV